MSKIQAGDTVTWRSVDNTLIWNVSQVHTSDHSADIWRMVDGRRQDYNVSLNALTKVTS